MSGKTDIKPLFDYVLIRPVDAEPQTASGIILPDSAKEKPQVGEVKAVGTGAKDKDGKLVPMSVKVGDKVLYKKWGGNEVKVAMEEWLLVKQEDLMATVS